MKENRIEPILAVFVPAGEQRHEEYATTRQAQFTAFIVNEIMPWVDRRYRTRSEPAARAVMGASDGGNISLWIGLNHPEVFGNVAAQSSKVEANVHTGFQNSPKLDLKLYLDLGTYDIPELLPRVRNFIPVLESKGYDVHYLEFHEGHGWGNWRAHIDNALEMFFPSMATEMEDNYSLPQSFQLLQNYPNPFNPATTITFSISRSAAMRLQIYNTRGQIAQTLLNQHLPPGTYSVVWDGQDDRGRPRASGVYLYQLIVDGRVVDTRKLILLK